MSENTAIIDILESLYGPIEHQIVWAISSIAYVVIWLFFAVKLHRLRSKHKLAGSGLLLSAIWGQLALTLVYMLVVESLDSLVFILMTELFGILIVLAGIVGFFRLIHSLLHDDH